MKLTHSMAVMVIVGTFSGFSAFALEANDTMPAAKAAAPAADQTDALTVESRGGGGSGGGGGFRPAPAPRPEPARPAPMPRPEPVRPAPMPRPEPVRPAPMPRPEPVRPAPRPDPVRPGPAPRPEPGRPVGNGGGRPIGERPVGRHYDPVTFRGGNYTWNRWDHPVFARPVYDWDWAVLRLVTCTAEDSEGDLYPVTEDGYIGVVYEDRVSDIEDAALDRCYSETNSDTGCVLLSCTPGY
jgi:hypothetical protein